MFDSSKPPDGGNGAGEYQPDNEGGDVKALRDSAEADSRWQKRISDAVDRLLWSLTPDDAKLDLFTWGEMCKWMLRTHRKRPREHPRA
jgi:hypothetical protein